MSAQMQPGSSVMTGGPTASQGHLLELKDVHKRFVQGGKVAHILRGVNLSVGIGEIVALVGESGSGKSTLARTIMKLYTPDEGTMVFGGEDVTQAKGRRLKEYRYLVQMLFQDPFASLNPTHSIRTIMRRSLPPAVRTTSRGNQEQVFRDALHQVGLTPPENFLDQFPHELSGGQRQRVALARSLPGRPKLVLADEPVSMLDVSLRLGVLNLMLELNQQYGMSYLYITHDLASARYVAKRIAVMYAGEIVEEGPAQVVIEQAKHPYTRLLVQAAPDPDRRGLEELDEAVFTGEPPNLSQKIVGCPFQFRCPHVTDHCRQVNPKAVNVGSGQTVKCHLYDE